MVYFAFNCVTRTDAERDISRPAMVSDTLIVTLADRMVARAVARIVASVLTADVLASVLLADG